MHGGTVTARSDGPGPAPSSSSAFRCWRAHEPAPSERARPPASDHSRRARRILVADDNHDAAEALALLLQLAGHDVRTAHDGVEALAVAKAFKPHVVLLDLGMPKMDGYETARQMRRQPWGKRHASSR